MIDIQEVRMQAYGLNTDKDKQEEKNTFDAKSRLKVYFLNFVFIASLITFVFLKENKFLIFPFILLNGFFSIPYLRVFIHSEMHWGLSDNFIQKKYFRYLAFAIYQVPFVAYQYGHRAHHRFDNDVPVNFLSQDKQSTYLYSKDKKPINFMTWIIHYLFAYQFFYQTKLVFESKLVKNIFLFFVQVFVILLLDFIIFSISSKFFFYILIPSLIISWVGSGIVLYMMHNVDYDSAVYHHSVNSYSKFFNKFGDNDGLHIVHSLYPFLHPAHAVQIDDLLKVDLTPQQKLSGHYVYEFFKEKFKSNS